MAIKNQNARSHYESWATDTTVLAGADPSATLVAAKTGHTIYVTHISVAVTTDNAATLLFRDSAGTPVVIAGTKASPGIGPILFDFGDDGTALTEAKAFALLASGAGLACRIHCEGYYKQTAAITA